MERDIEVRLVNFHGQMLWPLPEASVTSMSWALNNFGQMNFTQLTTSVNAEHAAKLHVRDVEVQVWFDGDLVWWGVPMTDGGGPGQQNIGCDGLFSYAEDFLVGDQTLEWVGVDQFIIVSDLIQYMQDESGQNFRDKNIGVDIPGLSGKQRWARYERAEHRVLAGIIREFPGLKEGFDFDIVFTPDGQRAFKVWYPERGVHHNNLMLEYGKNIENYSWNRSAIDMRTQSYATGGAVPGSETGKMEQVYEDELASAIYGVIQSAFSEGNQMDPDWLADAAERDVKKNNKPKTGVTLSAVDLEDTQLFGVVNPGDWVPVRIIDGYRQFEKEMRVGKVTWNPNETLSFEFVEEADEVEL